MAPRCSRSKARSPATRSAAPWPAIPLAIAAYSSSALRGLGHRSTAAPTSIKDSRQSHRSRSTRTIQAPHWARCSRPSPATSMATAQTMCTCRTGRTPRRGRTPDARTCIRVRTAGACMCSPVRLSAKVSARVPRAPAMSTATGGRTSSLAHGSSPAPPRQADGSTCTPEARASVCAPTRTRRRGTRSASTPSASAT